jgi:hypothetical protein
MRSCVISLSAILAVSAAFKFIELLLECLVVRDIEFDDELEDGALPRRCIPVLQDTREQRARVPT